MKKILILVVFVILLFSPVYASENFDEALEIMQAKIPCSELSDDQLEILGDYYMEQMHPGDLHEVMDERMGGEGSENLRLVHINMAKMFYCGQTNAMPMNMMSMMMNRGGNNMMYNFGMMSGYGATGTIVMIIFWIAVIWLIVWVIRELAKGKESSSDILEKRYAKGELSKKQYQEMKKTLKR